MTNARRSTQIGFTIFVAALFAVLPAAGTEPIAPVFTKAFAPDTIGPGSVSMLTFTIDNSGSVYPVEMMAFDDEFPMGMNLAAPSFVSNDCGGIVTTDDDDADSGFDVRLVDGGVGAGEICTIVVNVTATTDCGGLPPETLAPVECSNTSGALTSNGGSSGTAAASLFVDDVLPTFSKAFAPSTVSFGGRSTLTLTIDNSASAANYDDLIFDDDFPPGMVVADPANASTDCGHPSLPPTLTAVPGAASISLFANGTTGFPSLAAGDTCTVIVDVIGGAVGMLGNVTDALSLDGGGTPFAGKAAAVLEVTGVEDLLELEKEFIDDPVAPGGTATLEFTVTNKSRDHAATGITFDDDLEATLTGLTPTLPGSPDPPCGAGSALSFSMGVLTLTGGSLPPEGSCTFGVELAVPAAATPGTYPNATSGFEGTIDGMMETGNVAGDLLFVVSFPILTKEFTDDPVGTGGTVTLEFTITNTNPGSTLSDIEFRDELTDNSGSLGVSGVGNGFLPFPVSVGLPPTPNPPCGAGSSLSLVSFGTDREGLELLGGSLAEAGMAGDSCTFSLTVDIPEDLAGGTYTNTTEEITAVLDDIGGTPTVTGPPASGDLVVLAAPRLTKEFTDDPAVPGGSVTLEFTLFNADDTNAASAIAFTDDLGAALTGLTIASVDTDTCGGTPSGVGTDMFGYTGGSLGTLATCTISLTLTVPTMVGGTFGNTTSEVDAQVATLATKSPAASDDLVVTGLLLSKEFTDDPVIAGAEATLRFTLDNVGASDATGISFTDSLATMLPGAPDVTVVSFPPMPCGGTLTATPSTLLSFSGGTVMSGDPPCSFDVTVLVPAATADGIYVNVSSGASSSLGSSPPAVDNLVVDSAILGLTKEFTDDPVEPGDTVTLMFTLENLSATETVTDIEFDDDLDAALSGLSASGASMNDCGGMALGFPAGLFEYRGGTLLPGATCTIVLDVVVPMGPLPGNLFPNTTTPASGKVGVLDVNGNAASDDLEVQLLKLSKAFDGPSTATGEAVITFTLENLDSVNTATGLAFSDDLEAVISGLVATTLPPGLVCDTGTVAGTSFLTLSGATLPPSGMCTFDVTVTVPASATAGSFLNTTSDLFSNGLPVADPATAFLTIEPPPTFAKSFAPDVIGLAGTSTLTFTIDNTASTLMATDLAFMDAFPVGVVVAAAPAAANTCGGTFTTLAGATSVDLTGGTVGAGATCTLSVDVTATTNGSFVNTTGDLTSTSGNSGPASDTLTVEPPPTFAKSFAPDTIVAGEVSTLTFTIDNSASAIVAGALGFVDAFPAGIEVAAVPAATNTCGGTFTAVAAATSVDLAGGTVGAGATCTLSVDVTTTIDGSFVNTTGDLTSTSGNSGTASDTLTASPLADIEVTKNDETEPATAGGFLDYTLTVKNLATSTAVDVELVDALPPETSFVLAEPFGACAESMGVVTCDLGDLAGGADSTVLIKVRIDPDAPSPITNMATVSTITPESDLDNNDVMEDTDVLLFAALEILDDGDGNGFPEAAVLLPGSVRVLVKDVDTGAVINDKEVLPAGYTAVAFEKAADLNANGREDLVLVARIQATGQGIVVVRDGFTGLGIANGLLPLGFEPLAATVVDDDGFGTALVLVAAQKTATGQSFIFKIDAATGASTGFITLAPALVPIDLTTVPSITPDAGVEVATLAFFRTAGLGLVQVKELSSGAFLRAHVTPANLSLFSMETVPDFGDTPSAELAVLGLDAAKGHVRVRTLDADSGGVAGDDIFAVNASPSAVAVVDDYADTTAPELAALYRVGDTYAAYRLRDALSGNILSAQRIGVLSAPLDLEAAGDSYLTPAPEVAVLWVDVTTGALTVTLRDPGSGVTPVILPIP